MRSIDIDLRKTLEFRPERGELLLGGERMLLLNRGALRGLYELLYRDLGDAMTRAFLMQLGRRWGKHDHETLSRLHEWDTEQDHLTAGPVTHMWEGIAHAEATTVDFDRGSGHFLMRGIWRNSYEVDLNRELRGPGKADQCFCLAGHASGWASAFFGQPLLAIETACVSQGAPHCTFEIRPEAAFGPEAAPWRAALALEDRTAAGALQVALAARTQELGEARSDLDATATAARVESGARKLFVANMSHELRTPTAAILGLAESLGKTSLNAAQRRSLTLLRENAEALIEIMADVLELAQIEAHLVALETVPLDLAQVVEGAAAVVEPRARDKGLTFFVTKQDGFTPRIVGDAQRLGQVLLALMTSAVKNTDAGAVVVTLKAPEPLGAGAARYAIDVSDTGAGLAEDRLAQLFEIADAFAAGEDQEAAPRPVGNNLGLALSRRIARLMGGDIEVESQVGQGSIFRFSFPAQQLPDPPVRADNEPSAPPRVPRSGGLRVLVVEDNPVMLFLLREQLTQLGHETIVSAGGAEALSELERQSIDVVLTDLHMPVMDGFELNRELRSRPLGRQPYVVALTADASPRVRARCLAAGMDDFATKPLSQDGLTELMGRVQAAVASWPSSAAAAETVTGSESPIDEQSLITLRANLGSSELLVDLIATFIRDAHELCALFASSNDIEARRAAHSLKSTALAVGARPLASIAAEAEKGQPAAAMARARGELARVETALKTLRL